MEKDLLTRKVIGCAIEVHRVLGPGLLESAYEHCLARELSARGIRFEQQVLVPVTYKGTRLDCGYKIDVLVDGRLILELKAVDSLSRIHEAQLLTYMKLSNTKTGLLINFKVNQLIKGIKRFVL